MGKRFLRSIVQPFTSPTFSADITPVDLPVNPLSKLILTLRGTQIAQATPDNYDDFFPFRNVITALSVRFRGENVMQGSLTDLMMLNAIVASDYPAVTKPTNTTAAVRAVAFPLGFSRKPQWHEEAFPASSRGQLQLFMTFGALPADFSAMAWQLETVELIEDNPARHLKYITNTRTPTATGQDDRALPIGNPLVGVMLFDPNSFNIAATQRLWGQVKLLKDNVEQYFPLTDWESLNQMMMQRGYNPYLTHEHRHVENLAAAYAQFADTSSAVFDKRDAPDSYGYLDFDPLIDGSYLLETKGAADLKLRAFIDAGAALNTVRYLPVELVGH